VGILIGFVIAMAVGLTGVGGGSLTAPVLMLFLGVSPSDSVGTALIFSAITKLSLAPLFVRRKQVSYRVLGWLSLGGVPGVLGGFHMIDRLHAVHKESTLYLLIGGTILAMAVYNIWRILRPARGGAERRERTGWLALIAAAIGGEVGFSSAGAGALGSIVLLTLTTLSPAMVVGTDTVFGLVLSAVGGAAHFSVGHYDRALVWQLVLGGLPGAFLGANLSRIFRPRTLRLALLSWLTFIGGELCWRALAG
jgi:uncharacterized protein